MNWRGQRRAVRRGSKRFQNNCIPNESRDACPSSSSHAVTYVRHAVTYVRHAVITYVTSCCKQRNVIIYLTACATAANLRSLFCGQKLVLFCAFIFSVAHKEDMANCHSAAPHGRIELHCD